MRHIYRGGGVTGAKALSLQGGLGALPQKIFKTTHTKMHFMHHFIGRIFNLLKENVLLSKNIFGRELLSNGLI